MNDGLGKKAEKKIRDWLDRPEEGYCFDRIPDQMTGQFDSKNICDFVLFKSPSLYYLESKATWEPRFDFARITDYQYKHMLEKSNIDNVFSYVIILFATYQQTVMIDINEIDKLIQYGTKSINILKKESWKCKYQTVKTIPSRKELLDYSKEDNVL